MLFQNEFVEFWNRTTWWEDNSEIIILEDVILYFQFHERMIHQFSFLLLLCIQIEQTLISINLGNNRFQMIQLLSNLVNLENMNFQLNWYFIEQWLMSILLILSNNFHQLYWQLKNCEITNSFSDNYILLIIKSESGISTLKQFSQIVNILFPSKFIFHWITTTWIEFNDKILTDQLMSLFLNNFISFECSLDSNWNKYRCLNQHVFLSLYNKAIMSTIVNVQSDPNTNTSLHNSFQIHVLIHFDYVLPFSFSHYIFTITCKLIRCLWEYFSPNEYFQHRHNKRMNITRLFIILSCQNHLRHAHKRSNSFCECHVWHISINVSWTSIFS